MTLRVHFLGTRGSTPAVGPEFLRYGGHTSCVALAHGDAPPTLVLDAGTGLRRLGTVLSEGAAFRGAVLLGHLHWDHTHGLPFARALDHPDASVRLLLPALDGESAEQTLGRVMSPPNFPITPAGLRGSWTFEDVTDSEFEIEGFEVMAREIPHKGGRTMGYRVSAGGVSIAYLSDHAPQNYGPGPDGLGERHPAALDLATGVDVLIHDAQYTAAELPDRSGWGHAAGEYAIALGEEAGARTVVLYHHDPTRTDEQLDDLSARLARSAPDVLTAADGLSLTLESQ